MAGIVTLAPVRALAEDPKAEVFGFRWTPAYVTSNATGWWCDPFWGCYVTGSAQYAEQFEIDGGVTVRF